MHKPRERSFGGVRVGEYRLNSRGRRVTVQLRSCPTGQLPSLILLPRSLPAFAFPYTQCSFLHLYENCYLTLSYHSPPSPSLTSPPLFCCHSPLLLDLEPRMLFFTSPHDQTLTERQYLIKNEAKYSPRSRIYHVESCLRFRFLDLLRIKCHDFCDQRITLPGWLACMPCRVASKQALVCKCFFLLQCDYACSTCVSG